MSETQATNGAAAKSKTVYTKVKMEDGREVEFAGKRKMDKTAWYDAEKGIAGVRFDFLNGKTLSIDTSQLKQEIVLQSCAHGLSQKCGDNVAGVPEVDDMYTGVEEMIGQLVGDDGTWKAEREPGDSVAGTSIVVRGVAEAMGKSVEFVKEFIEKKLKTAKDKGEKLSRQDLYAAFRKPGTKTGEAIKRLEEERLARASSVNLDELMGELEAA